MYVLEGDHNNKFSVEDFYWGCRYNRTKDEATQVYSNLYLEKLLAIRIAAIAILLSFLYFFRFLSISFFNHLINQYYRLINKADPVLVFMLIFQILS